MQIIFDEIKNQVLSELVINKDNIERINTFLKETNDFLKGDNSSLGISKILGAMRQPMAVPVSLHQYTQPPYILTAMQAKPIQTILKLSK